MGVDLAPSIAIMPVPFFNASSLLSMSGTSSANISNTLLRSLVGLAGLLGVEGAARVGFVFERTGEAGTGRVGSVDVEATAERIAMDDDGETPVIACIEVLSTAACFLGVALGRFRRTGDSYPLSMISTGDAAAQEVAIATTTGSRLNGLFEPKGGWTTVGRREGEMGRAGVEAEGEAMEEDKKTSCFSGDTGDAPASPGSGWQVLPCIALSIDGFLRLGSTSSDILDDIVSTSSSLFSCTTAALTLLFFFALPLLLLEGRPCPRAAPMRTR